MLLTIMLIGCWLGSLRPCGAYLRRHLNFGVCNGCLVSNFEYVDSLVDIDLKWCCCTTSEINSVILSLEARMPHDWLPWCIRPPLPRRINLNHPRFIGPYAEGWDDVLFILDACYRLRLQQIFLMLVSRDIPESTRFARVSRRFVHQIQKAF